MVVSWSTYTTSEHKCDQLNDRIRFLKLTLVSCDPHGRIGRRHKSARSIPFQKHKPPSVNEPDLLSLYENSFQLYGTHLVLFVFDPIMSEESSSYCPSDLPFPETPSYATLPTASTTSGTHKEAAAGAAAAPAEESWEHSIQRVHQEPSTKTQDNLVDNNASIISRRLTTILSGISAPFCCGGVVRVRDDVQVMITTPDMREEIIAIKPPLFSCFDRLSMGRKNAWQFMEDYLIQQTDILWPLIKNASPAAFARDKETIIDPAIRKSKKLNADSFSINIIPDIDLQPVLKQIQAELNISHPVEAEMDALHIYEYGGKFVKHKDTPRDKGMLGTLVLCLPSLFRGGALTVEKMGQKHSMFGDFTSYDDGYQELKSGHEDWWPHPAFRDRQADATMIPWCAFLSDLDHEVEMVTGGVRVTLSFLLRQSDNTSSGAATADSASSLSDVSPTIPQPLATLDKKTAALVAALREYLADETFLEQGGNMAFPCEHIYTNSQVFPDKQSANNVLSLSAIQNLKGWDLVVAQATLDQIGLQVFLKPLIRHKHSSVDRGDYYLSKFPEEHQTVPDYMSDQDIEEFFHTSFQKCPEEMADIWVSDIAEAASEKIGECTWNPIGYFDGDETSEIAFYVHAFLLVVIPSFQDRQRLVTPRGSLKQG